MAYAAVRSKAVVLLLLIHCLVLRPLFVVVYVKSLFCYALLSVLSSSAIVVMKKRGLCALLLLSS